MEERLEIRQELQAAGVIGGVVDDFLPLNKFYLVYGEKNISLGDEVSPADVQSEPDRFSYDDYEPGPKRTFGNSIFILGMTDPDIPGREYLHWLITDFICTERNAGIDIMAVSSLSLTLKSLDRMRVNGIPEDRPDIYKPPQPMRTSKMVFTLFNKPSYDIFYTTSRGNFNTRGFATINILGPPIAAGFFYIKIDNENENENENDDHDNERRTSGTENDDHGNERRASGTECSTSGSTSKQEKTQKMQKKKRNVEVTV